MTEDKIIEMATIAYKKCNHIPNLRIPKEFIETFAKLIAEKEREECAKVCDELSKKYFWDDGYSVDCAESIRARGQE